MTEKFCSEKNETMQRPSIFKRYAGAMVLFVFGFFVTVIMLVLAKTLRSNDQDLQQYNHNTWFDIPSSIHSIKVRGNKMTRTLKRTFNSPAFIVGATVAVVAVIAGIVLYYLYPILTGSQLPNSMVSSPQKVAVPAVEPSNSEGISVQTIVSEVIYSIFLLLIFATAFFLLTHFGAHCDFKFILGTCAVLVTALFLLVRFQHEIIPVLFFYPKKLIIGAAQSTLNNVTV